MKRLILAALLAAGVSGMAHAHDPLKDAIANTARTPANAARDAARHPYETLSFFGIKPNMTVVELSPGGGWYTEILAPYLKAEGKLIAAGPSPKSSSAYESRSGTNFQKKLEAAPALFDKVQLGWFAHPTTYDFAKPGSVDMVLTFRNIHNWTGEGDDKLKVTLKSVYDALKPGGVFGVVDHRMPADKAVKADSGYLHEAYVIKMVESVGFKLAAKSEVNANPKDTADHNKGVWALPPVLANKDVDRAKYVAIGESDRMTLKFVKP
ncbi:MAG: methyltransferase [Pseudomonadota bacterium]